MKRFLFCSLVLSLLACNRAYACFNGETVSVSSGRFVVAYRHNENHIPKGYMIMRSEVQRQLPEIQQQWLKTKDVRYLSDYALLLSFNREYEKARDTYLQVEKLAPGRYATAASLGTVYELLGDNAKALNWIKKAVQIDPASHMGSEWLHVKILEAKLKGSSAVNSNFLLNTSFGPQPVPRTSMPKPQLLKLREALFYQLNERVSFIKPQDAIVAQLLFDLANAAYLTDIEYESQVIYIMAKEYGYSSPLLKARKRAVDNKIKQLQAKHS